MSSNLLLVTVKMDIGVDGIRLKLEAVHDDLAHLLKSAETFTVQAPTRHALGTSDVILLSGKGLGFVDRPPVDPNTPVLDDEDCGCDTGNEPPVIVDPEEPLIPVDPNEPVDPVDPVEG